MAGITSRGLLLAIAGLAILMSPHLEAQAPVQAVPPPLPPVVKKAPPVRKLKAVDADNRTVWINRTGMITLLLGTGEDSQDEARLAGKAVYPLRGRPDFQLVVVVDLRNSMAGWVSTLALSQMRANLDKEAIELKPYYLKNGNKSDPRKTSYVIADFTGTICPQLAWTDSSDKLRGILYGADGRELKRWDEINDMAKLYADIHGALQDLVAANQAKADAASKSQGTKVIRPPNPPPPLPTSPPSPPPQKG